MRFLAPLEAEYHVVATTSHGELPHFVRECAERARDLRGEYSEFFSQVERRMYGPPDCAEPERRLVSMAIDGAPDGTLTLGNLARCQAQGCLYTGECFAYMLTQNEPGRTNSHVGYSANPLREACLYNARHKRHSGSLGGGWRLEGASGPFTCVEHAIDYCQSLVMGTRGKEAKCIKMPWLSSAYDKPLYSYSESRPEDLLPLLACYDPCFAEVYSQMRTM